MELKINRELLPIKAHYFFFFAALGPLLPQMNVFGRQLGVSPGAMGLVTAVLPLMWATAKPFFGYLVDYFTTPPPYKEMQSPLFECILMPVCRAIFARTPPPYKEMQSPLFECILMPVCRAIFARRQRKLVFMLLILTMTGSYCGLWFLPQDNWLTEIDLLNSNNTLFLRKYQNNTLPKDTPEKFSCHWDCFHNKTFQVYMINSSEINTLYIEGELSRSSCSLLQMSFNDAQKRQIACTPASECDLYCYKNTLDGVRSNQPSKLNESEPSNESQTEPIIDYSESNLVVLQQSRKISTQFFNSTDDSDEDTDLSFYTTSVFWWFVVLMCVGTVAFNVANCIADAICFDVLGEARSSQYGRQRAWGTVGYGGTALLAGWLVDLVSSNALKDFTPAFILAIIFTVLDLLCCRALKLPSLSSPSDSGKALLKVLRMPKVLIFIVFAVVAGTFDSFIIYYMFWFLEELAEKTGHTAKIKLIEGVVIAAESFVGELLFFYFSGKIIKRFGYAGTMSFSLLCYSVRLALISVITNPWQLVVIEGVMQGPTYALCYSCIVGTAALVAPPGYSATVQGLVAGMDDGLGFAIGSLLGGLLYSGAGGRQAFRVMAAVAAAAAALHALLTYGTDREPVSKPAQPAAEAGEGEKMLPSLQIAGDSIYNDTVIPLTAVPKEV